MTTSFAGEGTDITKNYVPIIFCEWKGVNNNNNNKNNNNTYLLQLGCYLVAVVILHVNKT